MLQPLLINGYIIYIITIIVIIFTFSKINITLNILYGSLLAIITVYILFLYQSNQLKEYNTLQSIKQDNIIPPNKTFLNDHPDITNFLFSIQDLFIYNQEAYIKMVNSIEYLFKVLKLSKINNKTAPINDSLIIDAKKDAVNSLHSILINSISNKPLEKKIILASDTLNEILNNYLIENRKIIEKFNYENGYDNMSCVINNLNDPEPKNLYDHSGYSYEYI